MKIYTYVKINIETGETIEEISYEYTGPLALCGEDDDTETESAGGMFDLDSRGAFTGTGPGIGGAGFDLSGFSFGEPTNTGSVWSGSGPGIGGAGFDTSSPYVENDREGYYSGIMRAIGTPAQTVDIPNYDMFAVNAPPPATMTVEEAQAAYNKTVAEEMTKKLGSIGLLGLLQGGPLSAVGLMAIRGIVEGVKSGWNSYQVQQQIEKEFGTQVTPEQANAFIDQANSGALDVSGGGEPGETTAGITSNTAGNTGGNNMPATNPSSLTEIALDLYRKTDPARAAIIQRGMNFLEGGLDVTQSPLWGSGKNAAEVQYKLARDQILQNTPGGGRLLDTLSDTDTAKARTLTDLASTVGMDEYNKIYGLASGTPQQTISGLSSALGSSTALQSAQMQANAVEDASKNQLYGGLGEGIGEAWGDK